MTAAPRPYPAYKDSGISPLGHVPEQWRVELIGRLGPMFKGNGGSKDDEVAAGVPCVRYGDLYTRHEFFIRNTKACVTAERAASYTRIQPGDVLFAASGETIEDIGRSAVNLLEAPACCGGDTLVWRPRHRASPEFLGYVCDAPSSREQKSRMGRGFTVVHIYAGELKRLAIPLPLPEEQAAIVRYLDYMDRRIRRYIRAKQKLIKLLEEEKQVIIHRAVTGQVDVRTGQPYPAYKPSGIEWLGDVPEEWDVTQLRRLTKAGTTITYGIVQAGPDYEGGIPYIRTSDMRHRTFRVTGYLRTSPVIDNSYRRSKVETEDLVVAIRATLGKGMLVPAFLEGANLTQGTARVSPGSKLDARFLLHIFNSFVCQQQIRLAAKGTTFLEITLEALRRVMVLVPPLEEQRAIAGYIERRVAMDKAAESAEREIGLLREYRTRLIADVVTGKLDVREAAGQLPHEPDDDAPLEEEDGLDKATAPADDAKAEDAES